MTQGPGPPGTDGGGVPAEVLLEALPASVLVIDALGRVLELNDRMAGLVGRDRTALVGTSVLDLVDPETSWAYAAAAAMAADYPDVLMGPLRVTLLDAEGVAQQADLWARNRLDDPRVGGIVCLLTEHTAAVGLGDAVSAVAGNDPFPVIADRVAAALSGHPVNAEAVVLREDDDRLDVAASTAPDGVTAAVVPTAEPDDEQPWHTVARTGVRVLLADLSSLDDPLASAASAAGYRALWCEPISGPGGTDDEDLTGVLAVWRRTAGAPSPNELASVFQAASILALAGTPRVD